MAEVFGFPIDNLKAEANRHREKRLCPFNNKIPNCTKDKANDPLGVCSIFENGGVAVTCPVRFRENWIISDDAASFFFPPHATWTSLTEVKLRDAMGKSAGNIDLVLVQYGDDGQIIDFGAVEVQAVYISGNIRRPFAKYMTDPAANTQMNWSKEALYPSADFLSSSRKRLAPQLLFKGGILNCWHKKQAVVLDSHFFDTLPELEIVPPEEAEMAWLIYNLVLTDENVYAMARDRTVYTKFTTAMEKITKTQAGSVEDFVNTLQAKLDRQLSDGQQNLLIDEAPLT